ncbi:PDZ domain-containing protein [Pseudohongiella sp.]|uniref:PDZ domain-containing protein n=1 Tax=marine sediment metagenome TaxID=412755 RepID=A0A0F9W882_9ZZZZ|nr:PDZ domain-containing protein [Pseudohongiella sp.]HDZ09677.1 PDZ domain-containing protein [Pseudohongiella sp.]HEA61866.1 PDZ domain-containing protein [Pseudohongiella sp.]
MTIKQRLKPGGLMICLLALTACVSYEPRQLVPTLSLSPDNVVLSDNAGAPQAPGVNFGLTAGVNESDSLTNISVLPGIRVRAVAPGGAADRASIRAGDIILSIDGADTNHPDVLDALAVQTTEARRFAFEVRRNTTVFMTTLEVRPVLDQQTEPVELYRAEPVLLRAGFSTELLQDRNGSRVSGARVVRLFTDSPLAAADIGISDIILAVDDRLIESAQGLVSTLTQDYRAGQSVTLTVSRNNIIRSQRLDLWHPGRKLTRLSLWPLFSYQSTLSPDQTRLNVGDLILFSLFSYQRNGAEREYNVLGLFRTASDYGELIED